MTLDWYPGIRECCAFWPQAAMLQQTFESLEKSFETNNDACIDCAKSIVEVVCRVIVEDLDDPSDPHKPKEETPAFGQWVTAAVRVLKLGDNRDTSFKKLVSQHHKLTETLGSLRNGAGPVSHGRDGFIQRLSAYHHRAAVLSADAIVAFLHHAYLDAEVRMTTTMRSYDCFENFHALIDASATLRLDTDDAEESTIAVRIGEEEFFIPIRASELLFSFDRRAYVEALRVGREIAGHNTDCFDVIESPSAHPEATE